FTNIFPNLTTLLGLTNATSTLATLGNIFVNSNTIEATNDSGLALYDNASNGIFVADGGNVGVASTTPWGLLSINPDGISGPSLVIGSSTKTDFIVTNEGNVGIGTTTTNILNEASQRVLTMLGTGILTSGGGAIELIHPEADTTDILGKIEFINLDGGISSVARTIIASLRDGADDASNLQFFTEETGEIVSVKMTILGNGKVGIGTENPAEALDVSGRIVSAETNGGFWFGDYDIGGASGIKGSTYQSNWDGAGNSGIQFVAAHSSSPDFAFFTNNSSSNFGSAKFVVKNNGNIGIGTTTPDSALHVVSSAIMATLEKNTTQTVALQTGLLLKDTSTGDMGDGFGQLLGFAIEDIAGVENRIAGIGAIRDGADNEGALVFRAGTDGGEEFMRIDSAGNVGIASTTTSFDLAVGNSGMNSGDTTFTNTSHSSFKENISDFEFPNNYLEMFSGVKVKNFKYKDEYAEANNLSTKMRVGLLADEFNPLLGKSSDTKTISGDDRMNVMHEAIRQLNEKVDINTGKLSEMYVDESGNIGIGTTTPSYKLQVVGGVAATSFVNTSTRDAKKDIVHFDSEDEDNVLEKIKDMKVARYRYKGEWTGSKASNLDDKLSIGLIAEESPEEVLSPDGRGVDIYKLSSFVLAGVKAQQSQIEQIKADVELLKLDLASTTASSLNTEENSSYIKQLIIDHLKDLGLTFADGVAYFKSIVVESLTVGSSDNPAGITLYDEVTRQPYCLKISNGATVTQAGECNVITVENEIIVVNNPISDDTHVDTIEVSQDTSTTTVDTLIDETVTATTTDSILDNTTVTEQNVIDDTATTTVSVVSTTIESDTSEDVLDDTLSTTTADVIVDDILLDYTEIILEDEEEAVVVIPEVVEEEEVVIEEIIEEVTEVEEVVIEEV
ncbi:tail fiber domain-containing protein, partial [Patescibacteria group bacterium]